MKTYGLLGKNISYSLSPDLHNAAFKALKLDAEYKPFDIPENELDAFFSDLKKGVISGCNVTIPYKEKALEFVDKCDNMVKSVGALNTIVSTGGVLEAHNTDHEGFISALTGKSKGDLGFEPGGKNVFLFGAGGAARTVVFSLLGGPPKGVKKIAITDIDINKAKKLADSIAAKEDHGTLITVLEDRSQYNDFISKSDLLVNATPCGVKEGDLPLFDYRYIHEGISVFDLIYARDTMLVKEARLRGARVINGLNMLLHQAAASFKIWTGLNAPLEVMKAVLTKNKL